MEEIKDKWPELWQALWEHGASSRKEEGARRYWESLSKAQQDAVFDRLIEKLRTGGWVQYDPIRAIKENAPKTRTLIITSDEYYRTHETQENQDGWVRTFLPDQHKTIYVKQIQI